MPDEPNTAFIGILVPDDMDNCLRLMALLQDVSKSTLVRNLLQTHMEENDWTEPNLIERYAIAVHSQWVLRYKEIKPFKTYLKGIEDQLRQKKAVSEDLLKLILKKCREQNQ